VDGEVGRWERLAAAIPSPELRRQAQASLRLKRFHCDGGAVYSLAAGGARAGAVRFIVALQTISDYLDNLADRSTAGGAPDLAQLHTAMVEAVQAGAPDADPQRFYRYHPDRDDGGYLAALVAACRGEVDGLDPAAAGLFRATVTPLLRWYCLLQEYKHLPAGREEAVRRWCASLAPEAPGWAWWEVAAATGSTLGPFALFACAAAGELDPGTAARLRAAYFPYVTGLHILLDYWIDQAEDAGGGDMNFTAYYPSAQAAAARLAEIGRRAAGSVRALPDAGFHRTVVLGLPALYLADPKVDAQGLRRLGWRVLRQAGPWSWFLYWAVRWLRGQRVMRPAWP
jgi:tetraprenyl-beta-curcumene synthase